MTPPLKTKLLKAVCRRSELMRSTFRDPLQIKKTDTKDLKPSPINKTGERFRLKVTALSVDKSWPLIRKVCQSLKKISFNSFENKRNGSLSNRYIH